MTTKPPSEESFTLRARKRTGKEGHAAGFESLFACYEAAEKALALGLKESPDKLGSSLKHVLYMAVLLHHTSLSNPVDLSAETDTGFKEFMETHRGKEDYAFTIKVRQRVNHHKHDITERVEKDRAYLHARGKPDKELPVLPEWDDTDKIMTAVKKAIDKAHKDHARSVPPHS